MKQSFLGISPFSPLCALNLGYYNNNLETQIVFNVPGHSQHHGKSSFKLSLTERCHISAHNKLESVVPTFSSLESKLAPSNEGEHGEKHDNSGRKKHQDDESRRKSFSDQRKRIYLVNNIFEAWENANIEAG